MQQDTLNEQKHRIHAKLFKTDHGQVVAYLNRTDNDSLTVVLQLWVDLTDEQLRVAVQASDDDDMTQAIFDNLTDEGVPLILEELGVPAMIAEVEDGHE